MRKILLTTLLVAIMSACTNAQGPGVAEKYIRDNYKQGYTIVSVDTVAMPIRIIMSLNFATTMDSHDLQKAMLAAEEMSENKRYAYLESVGKKMRKTYSEYYTPEQIIAMRSSNAPHEDDYHNYQRTTVFLHGGGGWEEIYVRIGENSVSMTRAEYDAMEKQVFDALRSLDEVITILETINR